jgi:hypothetical protein
LNKVIEVGLLRGEELRDVDPTRIAGIVVEPAREMLDEAT